MIAFFGLTSRYFFTISNALTILDQIAVLAILATGLTVVMITGRIDLSIGYAVSALGVLAANALLITHSITLAVLTVILGGILIGAVNGFTISFLGIPDFIGTLAMGFLVEGVNQAFTRGYPVSNLPQRFYIFGQGKFIGIPISVFITLGILLITWFLLGRTRFGRYVYAIGGNEEAAVLSGVSVRPNILISYILCGVGAAVTGLVLTSRIGAAYPTAGDGMLLDTIATVFLGATAFRNGEANLWGTLLGVLIIGTMTNGLTLLDVPYYFQLMAKGLIIVVAVTITSIERRRAG
jgi:ribose transport system permease protein